MKYSSIIKQKREKVSTTEEGLLIKSVADKWLFNPLMADLCLWMKFRAALCSGISQDGTEALLNYN